MAAINFNRECKSLENGMVYNFSGHTFKVVRGQLTAEEDQNGTICRDGNNLHVTWGTATADHAIFRDAETVSDALACAFARPAHFESGNAPYKTDILIATAPMADGYGARYYQGVGGYHSHEYETRTDCPYYFGIELEVVARNEKAYNALERFTSNAWYMENDGSLPCYGIEYISTLIRPADAINPQYFEAFCNQLAGLAKSKTMSETGLHFHVSRAAFGETETEQMETAAKVSDMMDTILPASALKAIFGRDINRWCNIADRGEFSNALAIVKRTAGANIMRDDSIKAAYIADLTKYNKAGHSYRYYRLNLTNNNTIEFRQGKGQISSTAIATMAQFIDTIIKYCKTTKFERISARGYINSIPNSAKYSRLRDYFSNAAE